MTISLLDEMSALSEALEDAPVQLHYHRMQWADGTTHSLILLAESPEQATILAIWESCASKTIAQIDAMLHADIIKLTPSEVRATCPDDLRDAQEVSKLWRGVRDDRRPVTFWDGDH